MAGRKRINAYGKIFNRVIFKQLTAVKIGRGPNHYLIMFILRDNHKYFISSIEKPHRIWYPINLEIPCYGEAYVRTKLGITDPIQQRDLRIQFYEVIRGNNIRTDEVQYFNLTFDNTDYPFYLYQEYTNVVTVFMEKGLFTLGESRPGGYAWSVIYGKDLSEQIQEKLYDDRIKFGEVMHKKLRKICGW